MSEARRRFARARVWLALLVIVGVHLALVDYFFGAILPLPELPFNRGDFATHANQVRRVLTGLESGHHWVYDVQLLAGAPNGVLFDADVKGWELWTWALVELGVGEGRAYNAFVLAVHLALPIVVFGAARIARLDRRPALAATGLAVLLWSFDSFTHWMWFIGTVTYSFVAYFALLPLALFYRWLEDRRPVFAIGCALSLALGHLVHPYIFFILVAPMLALYVRAAWVDRDLRPVDHGITLGIAAVTLGANFWWLKTALRFFHYILDSAFYAQGGIEFLFYDLFGLLHDPSTQGMIGPRTAVRLLITIAALAGLRAWRRSGDRRHLPCVVLIVTMAALTYLGGYTPAAQIQPYRHNLPLGFALLIPAASWLSGALESRPWQTLRGPARGLALILGLLALLHLTRDALYFFAPSMRDRQPLDDGREVLMNTLGHAYTPRYRYDQQNQWEGVVAWVAEHDDGQGRWLVRDQVLGEYLMARTQAQLIGGFMVRNIEHSDANWFRRAGDPPYSPEAVARYFQTYGVRWLIVPRGDRKSWWDEHPRLVTRAGFVDEMIIYQVNVDTRLLRGRGRVDASVNRIEVTRTRPDEDLVLRYHWMETLRCAPDCKIAREPVKGDRVGFIRVPAPHPRDFVIENAYVWE
ncbi:hypothetical protein ENSA5_28310 [Enhygromyxa salina]|uniref:Glycosyltransferase RgtA/B/C/D-like domain-containing protein n=1 Tax=Enhygromyxa salina TaxID=215803 RepID=A0A2S9Y4J1_9BACT|nr:hypothetical protein [Enhygromyxa salina]PRQ00017.1 hypothetical protein ENSA5_28310 [Enhygromyxa salina]